MEKAEWEATIRAEGRPQGGAQRIYGAAGRMPRPGQEQGSPRENPGHLLCAQEVLGHMSQGAA